jgi:hypothetical protein
MGHVTTTFPAPADRTAPTTPTTPGDGVPALPIYRQDERAQGWRAGRRSVVGVVVGAVVGTVVLSWFGLVLGAAVGLGVGMLLDNRPAEV